ncbi:nucleotide-diphospho-sugar transferase [Colletotrichum falcatum]|nr:nucleotide-diphospho-sugar transferase [Colletotrichum falcatum]
MASSRGGDQVYATLLLNDTYLPGALVLAHSLRDAGTSKQLVVLVTLDTVSAEVITELKAVYDHVIPVPRIRNARPANLYLMNRPDLHSAFTKVNLWRQTQFSKIIYIDADVVAYRAPDELFDIAAHFSAAPDIGWPDLFNTGVMVLSPNMGDYYALIAMAERGISFDGADQGLLNMHFKNTYNRISFTYNVTPSAHYQYVPAYRHFQSSINMVHFIGPDKPWFQGRQASKGDSPFEDMIGRWKLHLSLHFKNRNITMSLRSISSKNIVFPRSQPPPADSRPEALNFPSQTYEMSQDPAPFVPPERYPSPPRNMWYEVPKQKPTQKPRPLFPWEANQPKPTRTFTADLVVPEAEESSGTPTGEEAASSGSQAPAEPSLIGPSTTGQKSEPSTPSTPTIKVSPSNPWTAFTRTNAWDEVPEIERYVEGLQKHRRGKSQGLVGVYDGKAAKEHGLKLTDFPSVVERPSLPVTPAPIRRPKFWGGGPSAGDGDNEEELPVAQGVPPQSDWDPSAQLQKLAKQQSEALLKKLGGGEGGAEVIWRGSAQSAAGKRQRDHECFAQSEW